MTSVTLAVICFEYSASLCMQMISDLFSKVPFRTLCPHFTDQMLPKDYPQTCNVLVCCF